MALINVSRRTDALNNECDISGVLNDIAQLSSEFLGVLMRESRIATGYQCSDEWVIGQVRNRFQYFVKHCLKQAGTWESAWKAYMANFHAVHDAWKCSFAGSTDYAWGNFSFEVRSYANPNMGWADGYFDSGIMKQLGCVFCRCSMSDGYPPAEVIAAFPGYTPLTATFDWVEDAGSFLGKRVENWQYVCHPDFEPPRHGEMRSGNFTAYMAVDCDRIDFELDIKPYRHSK